METECIQFELDLQGGRSRKVVVRNDGDINSSDGGMLHRLAQPRTGNLLAGGFAEAGGLRFGPGVRGPHRPRSVASRSDFGCGLRGGLTTNPIRLFWTSIPATFLCVASRKAPQEPWKRCNGSFP